MNKRVQEWFSYANADLLTAKSLRDIGNEKLWPAIVFHAQQASEKSIKGYLISHGIKTPKTHNIEVLLNLIEKVSPSVQKKLIDISVDILEPYSVSYRYPDAVKVALTLEIVARSIEIAAEVVSLCSSEVGS